MVTTEFTHGPIRQSFAEGVLAAAERLANRAVAAWQAAQNRRAVAKLLSWDDRMLHDIGLTQGDVYSVMAARGEDPSRRLTLISAERRAAIRAEALQRLSRGTEYDPNRRRPRRRFELREFER